MINLLGYINPTEEQYIHKYAKVMKIVILLFFVVILSSVVFAVYYSGTYKSFLLEYLTSTQREQDSIVRTMNDDLSRYSIQIANDKTINSVINKTNFSTESIINIKDYLEKFKVNNDLKNVVIVRTVGDKCYDVFQDRGFDEDVNEFLVSLIDSYNKGKRYVRGPSVLGTSNQDSIYYTYDDFKGYKIILEKTVTRYENLLSKDTGLIDYDYWIYNKNELMFSSVTDNPIETDKIRNKLDKKFTGEFSCDGNLYLPFYVGSVTYLFAVDYAEVYKLSFESAYALWLFAVIFFVAILIVYAIYEKKYLLFNDEYSDLVMVQNELNVQTGLEKSLLKMILTDKERRALDEYFAQCNCLYVVVIKIDDINERMKTSDISLYKYGIMNICEEIMSEVGNSKAATMHDDLVGVIVGRNEIIDFETMDECMKAIKESLKGYIGGIVTLTVSRKYESINDFIKNAYKIENVINYRYVFGKGSIIFEDRINNQKTLEYPVGIHNEIINGILKQNINLFDENIKVFLDNIKKVSYGTAKKWSQTLLFGIIKNCDKDAIDILLNSFMCETMDEFAENIRKYVFEADEMVVTVNNEFVQKVMKVIDENFENSLFCMKTVSEELGYTSEVYFGRKFKAEFGVTFNEFLSNYRIEKSLTMLVQTDYKVSEISEKCGFRSVSYFTSLFKKRISTTPNKYRDNYKKM